MELRDYWRIVVRRGWIIVLVAALTATSAYLWSRAQTPQYRSTVYINVVPGRPDWGQSQAIKQIMRNYARQITSIDMLTQVANENKLDLSPYDLASKITASPIESDLLLQVNVEDTDPIVAQNIANSVAEEFVAKIKQDNLDQRQEDRIDVSKLDEATAGAHFAPKPKINTLAGGLLGIVMGGLIVLALEFFDDTIKTTEDVERYVDEQMMVLATIPPAPEEADLPSRQPEGARRRLVPLRRP